MVEENKLRIVWYPIWKCNFDCYKYCPYDYKNRAVDIYGKPVIKLRKNTLTHYEWTHAFSKLPPFILDISGGEPLLYSSLDKVLSNLKKDDVWAITSNTSVTSMINKLIDSGAMNSCISWSASFHPISLLKNGKENPFADIYNFIDNLLLVRDNTSGNVKVNIVLHEDIFDKIEEYIDIFKWYEFDVTVLPYLDENYEWKEKNLEIVKRIRKYIDESQPLGWSNKNITKFCSAGKDYIHISSDGEVYRCYSQMVYEGERGDIFKASLGNILEKKFKLNDKLELCKIPCYFPCDRERTKQYREDGSEVIYSFSKDLKEL